MPSQKNTTENTTSLRSSKRSEFAVQRGKKITLVQDEVDYKETNEKTVAVTQVRNESLD